MGCDLASHIHTYIFSSTGLLCVEIKKREREREREREEEEEIDFFQSKIKNCDESLQLP